MSFELNLAVLPNSALYLDGCQLSYIKVYVHIFNLWNSHKPCFITNEEFSKRTGLHKDTVINAITFFEKHGVLKRVQKGRKRFLVQTTRYLETESSPVDKSESGSTNDAHGSELDRQRVGARPLEGSELDRNNIKYNNKLKKSFCSSNDLKAENQKKHSWADKPKAPTADVTKQSTSWKPSKEPIVVDTTSENYQAFINSVPSLRRKRERMLNETNEFPTGTEIQPEISNRNEPSVQGATIDAEGHEGEPSPIRRPDRLLEARSACSYFEEIGLADSEGGLTTRMANG